MPLAAVHIGAPVFLIALLAVIVPLVLMGVLGLLLLGWMRRRTPARSPAESADEARLIQEMFHRLEKMALRVEHLETLLLEKEFEAMEQQDKETAHEQD